MEWTYFIYTVDLQQSDIIFSSFVQESCVFLYNCIRLFILTQAVWCSCPAPCSSTPAADSARSVLCHPYCHSQSADWAQNTQKNKCKLANESWARRKQPIRVQQRNLTCRCCCRTVQLPLYPENHKEADSKTDPFQRFIKRKIKFTYICIKLSHSHQ